ncbi:RNA--NAD 2'-phosphotransferase, partial [Salmonella enterica subsp. enterica serovar Typhimurium]|nr:RNA--NAD 2'-phosphotransferase [Salmonella enterica subsp. enterica serovar Typhimurium]
KTGYPFYLADNGVWLTPHVPIKYLSQKKPG